MLLYRNDLIELLSKKGYTKKDSGVILKDVFDMITEALVNGDSVQVHGFGTFEVGERAAREGINPRTRETIKIAAAKTPKFKAGKQLKDSLN